ncbi:Asp23/Gls24 family envelope stress response protein [Frondihabitans sp. PAMC 28766]|uniref:Asp23/Gls24 family envelope stress response protein n=1 Tax=Frondihabitans sp. PAMC 28766 TaxID=1795630 RepID=UPI001EF4645B|nr:Asp23/Gls24 family envelope stress response protein [Frondihabitans sp. PAMC 28766]
MTFSAEYPVDLQKVATDVRSAVILAVETIVGFEVTAVNITINDLYTPDPEGTAPRSRSNGLTLHPGPLVRTTSEGMPGKKPSA